MCAHRETWLIPYSWQFNFSLRFQELRLVGITWTFPVVVLKWGNGVMGDIQHSIEGTLAQGSYLLSRLGNTRFPCSLMSVDMVWTQLAITSLSRPAIHVHSESGSRLYCSGLFSHPPLPAPMHCLCQPVWTSCHFPHTVSSCCSFCSHSPPSFPDKLSSSCPHLITVISSFEVYIQFLPPPDKINFPLDWSHSTLSRSSPPPWPASSVLAAVSFVSFCPPDAGVLQSRALAPFASLLPLCSLPKWLIQVYDIKYYHQYADDFQVYLFCLELSLNSRPEYTATSSNFHLDTNRHLKLNMPPHHLLISPPQICSHLRKRNEHFPIRSGKKHWPRPWLLSFTSLIHSTSKSFGSGILLHFITLLTAESIISYPTCLPNYSQKAARRILIKWKYVTSTAAP